MAYEGDINQTQAPPLPVNVLQSILPNLLSGGTPQAAPQVAAPMAAPQGAPQQTPSAIPPTIPFDLASMVKQVSALPEYQAASGRLEDIGRQEQGIQQQMQGLKPPQMGFHPNIVHGEGVGGFFHNLGQALLTVLASTRPGQEVQSTIYGPGIRQYSAQKQSLADQLAALKEQETIPTEELRATTGLTQAAGLAGYRGAMAQAATTRAQAYAQHQQDLVKNWAANLNLHGRTLDEKERHDLATEAQAKLNQAEADFRALHRDATSEEVAGIMAGTREAIVNEVQAQNPSLLGFIKNALGMPATQIEGAPSPVQRSINQPTPPKPTKTPAKPKSGAQQFHYDKNGNRVQGP